MKKLIVAVTIMLAGSMVTAQAWTGKADQKLQVGLSAWGNGTGITGTYDYGLSDIFSLGGGVNFYFSNFEKDKKENKTFVFGRVNGHLQDVLNLPEQWDIYPGLDIGLLGNTFDLGVHLGARYFFNEKFGAFIEAGNNGSLGLSINL